MCSLLTIRCNAMLKTVELPAGVANLDPGLPDMDGETLPHDADQTWWIVGSEAGARCAADPRLSRGGGEGSRWRKSRKSRVRPEPAQTEPALANLNFEGLEGFNVRKSGPIEEVAFKSKGTKGRVID